MKSSSKKNKQFLTFKPASWLRFPFVFLELKNMLDRYLVNEKQCVKTSQSLERTKNGNSV